MLPEGWTSSTIGEIAAVTSGGTPSRKEPDYWNGNIPWVTTSLIDFNTINETEERITRDGVNNSSSKVYSAGTLLMAMFGQGVTRGKVAILGIDAAFNQACVAITPKAPTLNRFLFHNLATRYEEIRSLSNTGSQENLNAALIRSIRVDLPTTPEIKGIVKIGDSWDRGIQQLSDLIAVKVRFKQGLMQQLLTGKKRFPNAKASGEVRRSPFGNIPDEWNVIPLSHIVKEVRRKNTDGTRRVLTASGTRGLVDQREYFNRKIASDSLDKYFLLKRGEFAYNRSLMKGYPYGATKRLDDYDSGVLSTLYLCFQIFNKQCNSDFLVLLFESGILNSQLRSIARMGARAHGLLNVNASDFFEMVIPLPSSKEQEQIASCFRSIDTELDSLRQNLELLKQQKKGLMQKLLTGEIRVKSHSGRV